MEFMDPKELNQATSLVSHSLFGLHREDLIEAFYYGNKETLEEHLGRRLVLPDEGGIWVTPSSLGMELFSRVNGQGNLSPSTLFHQTLDVPEGIIPCARILNEDDLKPQESKKS